MALCRRRPEQQPLLRAGGHHRRQRRSPGDCVALAAGRAAAEGVRDGARQLHVDADHDRQRRLRDVELQPRRGARGRDRRGEVGLRSARLRDRDAAARRRVPPPRRGDVAGCAGRQQAANLSREPLPALQPRRRDRQAGRIVRSRGDGRHQQGSELADRVVALRDQRRADDLQRPRDPRQRDRRQPALQEDAARRRARLSRANRQAGMAVVVDSAVADRRRRRDLGERVVARRRADRDLARRDGRREARAGLSPDGKSRQPLLRRRASGRQPVRRDADRAGRRNRRPPVALSSSSTTASGTTRCPRRRC